MTDWDSLGITPKQAARWMDLGFEPDAMDDLLRNRWTPQRAEEWIRAGFPPDDANAGRGWRPVYMAGRGFTPDECLRLHQAGINYISPEMARWARQHGNDALLDVARAFHPEVRPGKIYSALEPALKVEEMGPAALIRAARMGLSPQAVPRWCLALGSDPNRWRSWISAGVSAEDARRLAPSFATPSRAKPWTDEGFSAASAAAYASEGHSLRDAKRLRRDGVLPQDLLTSGHQQPIPWSQALRRSRGHTAVFAISRRNSAADRVFTALGDLGATETRRGAMFSDYVSLSFFLDGGFYSCDGYGFGSQHGEWIFGLNALALVCDRAGLTRPRWSTSPPRDELSDMWEQQRLSGSSAEPGDLGGRSLADLDSFALRAPAKPPGKRT